MSALERIKELPDWPARMTAPVAAAYMGISETAFRDRFKDRGVREGANLLWSRGQLDAIVAAQFGMTTTAAPASVVDEIAAWKAGRGRK